MAGVGVTVGDKVGVRVGLFVGVLVIVGVTVGAGTIWKRKAKSEETLVLQTLPLLLKKRKRNWLRQS